MPAERILPPPPCCRVKTHRLGQTRHVTVEYLYADKTVDGFMLALINRKQQIFDKACDGLADPEYLLGCRRGPADDPENSSHQRRKTHL
jgi:hypothetical protein